MSLVDQERSVSPELRSVFTYVIELAMNSLDEASMHTFRTAFLDYGGFNLSMLIYKFEEGGVLELLSQSQEWLEKEENERSMTYPKGEVIFLYDPINDFMWDTAYPSDLTIVNRHGALWQRIVRDYIWLPPESGNPLDKESDLEIVAEDDFSLDLEEEPSESLMIKDPIAIDNLIKIVQARLLDPIAPGGVPPKSITLTSDGLQLEGQDGSFSPATVEFSPAAVELIRNIMQAIVRGDQGYFLGEAVEEETEEDSSKPQEVAYVLSSEALPYKWSDFKPLVSGFKFRVHLPSGAVMLVATLGDIQKTIRKYLNVSDLWVEPRFDRTRTRKALELASFEFVKVAQGPFRKETEVLQKVTSEPSLLIELLDEVTYAEYLSYNLYRLESLEEGTGVQDYVADEIRERMDHLYQSELEKQEAGNHTEVTTSLRVNLLLRAYTRVSTELKQSHRTSVPLSVLAEEWEIPSSFFNAYGKVDMSKATKLAAQIDSSIEGQAQDVLDTKLQDLFMVQARKLLANFSEEDAKEILEFLGLKAKWRKTHLESLPSQVHTIMAHLDATIGFDRATLSIDDLPTYIDTVFSFWELSSYQRLSQDGSKEFALLSASPDSSEVITHLENCRIAVEVTNNTHALQLQKLKIDAKRDALRSEWILRYNRLLFQSVEPLLAIEAELQNNPEEAVKRSHALIHRLLAMLGVKFYRRSNSLSSIHQEMCEQLLAGGDELKENLSFSSLSFEGSELSPRNQALFDLYQSITLD